MNPWLLRSTEAGAGPAARTDCSIAAKHPASAVLLLTAVAGALMLAVSGSIPRDQRAWIRVRAEGGGSVET